MRPYGTSSQLASRRQQALRLLRRGHGTAAVAKRIGATARSVRRWRRERQRPKRKSKARAVGRPCRLSARQVERLVAALKRGAFAHGYAEEYWTLDRVAHLIWELFGIRYRPSGVWYLLQRMGWSCQRPQRRALQRDDAAIAHWKHYVWPQIKKVA